jgi:hypothetical protein
MHVLYSAGERQVFKGVASLEMPVLEALEPKTITVALATAVPFKSAERPVPGRETQGGGCQYLLVTYFVPWSCRVPWTQRTSQEQGSLLGGKHGRLMEPGCSPGPGRGLFFFNFTRAFLEEATGGATIDGKRARKVRNGKSLADFLGFPPVQEVGKVTFGHLQQTSPLFNSTRGAHPSHRW